MSYCIRLLRWEDVARVTEIDREAFLETMPPTNYQRELRNPLAHYIVAYDDQREIGEIDAGEASPGRQYIIGLAGFWMMVDEAHIVNIAVMQSYRRQGIGELLLIHLVDLAMEKNVSIITLEVRASNTIAQSLYLKYGFAIKGVRRGYYSDDKEDAVIMTAEDIKSALFQTNLNKLRKDYSRRWDKAPYQIM